MAAGIILQWHYPLPITVWCMSAAMMLVLIFLFGFLPLFLQFRLALLRTFLLACLIVCTGSILVWQHSIANRQNYYGYTYNETNTYVATLLEAPVEKTKVYKALASIDAVIQNNTIKRTVGKAILYFKKDTAIALLSYGTQIITHAQLQPIKNAGNPGSFDYKRYLLFQQTTAQAYITPEAFTVLPGTNTNWTNQQLLRIQAKVLNVIKTNIKGSREAGLAEALLIGYKDDLDKTLLESYTNTGVVHIIAVSGMHLGLIYWVLNILFRPLLKSRHTKWLHPVLVLAILWLFTLLTGGAASIMRAAVMFTCILLGKTFNRQSSIYNTLAMSAFLLLCYNPFWLWDVGFQLSYAAVLSIVIFYKPLYHLLFIKNKLLDYTWQLVCVTIAAQILTTPISLYHFHQFPVYFLLTNLIAVPLSSLILIGELVLLVLAPVSLLAQWLGIALQYGILWLNNYIAWVETLPMALWEGFLLSQLQVVILFIAITGLACWWLHRLKLLLFTGLAALVSFSSLRFSSFYQTGQQQKMIVYHIPDMQAVDFINGNQYYFVGDSSLVLADFARNFHLKPSRTLHRITAADSLQSLARLPQGYIFGNKTILLIEDNLPPTTPVQTVPVDVLILSRNLKLYVNQLTEKVQPRQVVIDGSVPQWKARRWKQDFDDLNIACHNVNEQGAFVMNLR